MLLLFENRRKEAITVLTTALERSRTNGEIPSAHILFDRSVAREGEGDLEGALEDMVAARESWRSAQPFFTVRLASLWRRLGRVALADEGFERAIATAREVGSISAWTVMCFATWTASEWLWLERCGREMIAAHPDQTYGYVALAESLRKRKMLEESERWADRAVHLDPRSVGALSTRSAARLDRGDLDGADSDLARLAELQPADPNLATARASLLYKRGRVVEAIDAMRRVAEADPRDHYGNHNLAELLVLAGRTAEAMPVLERAIETDPTCRRARELKLIALQEAKRFEDALAAADAAISALPDGADLRLQRAVILHAMGRTAESLAEFERACRADPKSPLAHLRFGFALATAGRWKDSLEESDKALAVGAEGDERSKASQNRLVALQQLERFPEALTAVDAELVLQPDSAMLHDARRLILWKLGRYRDSAREAERFARDPALLPMIEDIVGELRRRNMSVEARTLAAIAVEPGESGVNLLNFAYLAAVAGKHETAREVLRKRPTEVSKVDAYSLACTHALLGDRAEALRWLGISADKGLTLPNADPDPDFVSLTDDRAFAAIWERLTPRR